jgi:hypothetical protein
MNVAQYIINKLPATCTELKNLYDFSIEYKLYYSKFKFLSVGCDPAECFEY